MPEHKPWRRGLRLVAPAGQASPQRRRGRRGASGSGALTARAGAGRRTARRRTEPPCRADAGHFRKRSLGDGGKKGKAHPIALQSFRAYRAARVRGKKYPHKKRSRTTHILHAHALTQWRTITTHTVLLFETLVYTVLCGTPRPGRRRDRVLEAGRGCRRERAQLMLEAELEVGCSGMLAPSTTSE